MKLLLTLLIGTLLTGCGYRSDEDIEQWMQQAGKDIKGSIEPIPPMTPYVPAAFSGQNLVPPFNTERLQIAKKAARNMPDANRPRELLENYDLDKLKLVGTVAAQARQDRAGQNARYWHPADPRRQLHWPQLRHRAQHLGNGSPARRDGRRH